MSKSKELVLIDACVAGMPRVVECVLDEGVDLNCTDGERYPLREASKRGHTDIIKLLLDRGADVNLPRRSFSTALYEACARAQLEAVKLLLEAGADPNNNAYYNLAPLSALIDAYVCAWGYEDGVRERSDRDASKIIKLLIDAGADVNALQGKDDAPILVHYVRYSYRCPKLQEFFKIFVDAGADVNARDARGRTALNWLMSYKVNSKEAEEINLLVNFMLSLGADVNLADNDGSTPLHRACFNGSEYVVKNLLEAGADVNARVDGVYTPDMVAMWSNNYRIAGLVESARKQQAAAKQ